MAPIPVLVSVNPPRVERTALVAVAVKVFERYVRGVLVVGSALAAFDTGRKGRKGKNVPLRPEP
jgi:hypothetical protein